MQAARGQHGGMLQVALAPAAVADGEVGQRGRAFLVAAGQAGEHVHGPAGAAEQGGLDEIVAHDVAAERLAAAQGWQTGGLGEGAGADDGVVAPVIAFGAAPPGETVRDQRAIEPAGELLHAGE